MKVGTKSVLFGAHCFFIHPWFVALAWWKLYGFPFDPRLWVAFFVHDLGYWGKPNMDGPEGEEHVKFGAKFMRFFFDWNFRFFPADDFSAFKDSWKWHDFCIYHSRFWCKQFNEKPSKLCFADKLSYCLTPVTLYIILATLSGEIKEYMNETSLTGKHSDLFEYFRRKHYQDKTTWFCGVQLYMRDWVNEHKDGSEDTWTPDQKKD